MMWLKYLLVSVGTAMFVVAVGILAFDLYRLLSHRSRPNLSSYPPPALPPNVHWRTSLALAMLAWAPLLVSAAIIFVPSSSPGA